MIGSQSDPRAGSRSLAEGAALSTFATAISRLTGFVRVIVVAAALGTTYLANTYQTANTAPNVVFELVAAGVLTSIFVPTFVEYLVKDQREAGWAAGNALTSVALVGLVGLAVVVALGAPLIMRALTIGVRPDDLRHAEIELGTTFLRLFSPQIVFYGIGMIMTGALHAHRRFVLAAVAPIFNNVVVIAVYLTYAAMRGDAAPTVGGITRSQELVLGLGTTAGVVVMTLCLIPQLRSLGWRFRFHIDTSHPAVRRGARLGAWALFYAGGYQAGLLVVLVLANRIEGGVAAYQFAYTFFYLPHALFAVPIFNVLFPAMAEEVAQGRQSELMTRLRDGLGMLAFILVPIAAALLAVAEPLATVTLEYGVMTGTGTELVGRVLAAFAIGLPAYSTFLVLTRAFYALGDTKTPALVNAGAIVVASAIGAGLFLSLPDGWAVPGLALGHSIAFGGAALVLGKQLTRRAGALGATSLTRSVVQTMTFAGLALAAMLLTRAAIPDDGKGAALVNVVMTLSVGAVAYIGCMAWAHSSELDRLIGLVRRARSR